MTALATTASSSVLIAVLAAAVLHASWNAIAHAVRDRLVGFTLMGIVYTVGGAVIAAIAARPSAASWGFLAASAVLHVAYNLLLMRSYRLGQFGQVYPLARGTSPLLVAITAAVFVGEPLPSVQLAGVLVISAGLASLVLTGGLPSRAGLPAITAAVATGVMIAAYTTVDGLGVRRAGTAAGYIGWLFLLQGPALPLIALTVRGRRLPAQIRPHLSAGLTGGVLSLLAYALVLWAQTRGALAPIAALRETSVIIGAVIATVLFREPFGAPRITATVLVATGVVLINL